MTGMAIPIDLERPYVVTGASSGIGHSVTELLTQHGAQVIAVDIAQSDNSSARQVITGDVADAHTWELVGGEVESVSADGAASLITCAGVIEVGPLAETQHTHFERLFRVNTLGVLHGIQQLIPAMAERGGGSVVAVASIDSLFAENLMSAYSTSKGALLQLIRSTAIEYARFGVQCNAVCPGAVDTALLRAHLDTTDDPLAARRRIEQVTPAGRLLSPEEIANLLVFLSSPLASAVAGAAVVADGALTATYDFSLDS